MKTIPFDPARYLDNEESIQAYLADARLDGPEAVARAEAVVARARSMTRPDDVPSRKTA